ncbi:hypothetical protein RJ639_008618 [Escallonia herrerae]|uniref:Transcription factor CBF/NF-Y/archaeal histone domain-containing protein n=1 Tax=Escallonia herrerae TaxID=1293975 RepID=A0AA89AQB4_9ASTE|nr:hypothetical protein RJ639_008618 [Escallonia herrerae]
MADEQDRLLPIANVGRIMKQILPPSAKISKEAKERIQECVSEFICFVTGEASDKCHKENRKTVNGDDLCWALSSLGFDNYAEATTKYLYKYREFERERANQNKATSVVDKDEAPRFDKGVQPGKEIDTTPASLQFRVLERGQTPLASHLD